MKKVLAQSILAIFAFLLVLYFWFLFIVYPICILIFGGMGITFWLGFWAIKQLDD